MKSYFVSITDLSWKISISVIFSIVFVGFFIPLALVVVRFYLAEPSSGMDLIDFINFGIQNIVSWWTNPGSILFALLITLAVFLFLNK